MLQENHFDIVVVGAGIVGLCSALAFAKRGLHVAIIEANQPNYDLPLMSMPYDTKVVAITRASEYFLAYLGVWSVITSCRYSAYQHMTVWDSVMDGRIEFCALDLFEDNLGYIIEQRVIISALWQALIHLSNVKIFSKTTIDQMHFKNNLNLLTLSTGITIDTSLVIAADGANSSIREKCHIQTKAWEYQQTAIVATVQGTCPHHLTAFQRFDINGPLALLPLAIACQSAIVWTTSPEKAKALSEMSKDAFSKALTNACDNVMGEMTLIGERVVFPLKTHHAKQYAVPGCVLVGDAAHTIHPLAGLGVNLGLMDVAALVEILLSEKSEDFGNLNLLKRYERRRKIVNQTVIWIMELFKQGFGTNQPFIQRARNIGLNWVNNNLSLKHFFVKMALGTIGSTPLLACKGNERKHDEQKDAFI